MALNMIMLGPPGAGKGTQASRLAASRGVPQISTGEILRDAVQAGTELGLQAKAVMDAGELVNDEIMVGIVRERLARPDVEPGFVLDGFPRTVPQATALDTILAGRDPLVVIELAVEDDDLVRRLSLRRVCGSCGANYSARDGEPPPTCARCGGVVGLRSDDQEETVRERLKVYHRETRPLVDFYDGRPSFGHVDGSVAPDEVATAVKDAVAAAMSTS